MMFSGPTPYVLTRLHVRYGKDVLGDDLVFKTAPAIAGGREQASEGGTLERGATPSIMNNFQARYAIRHPWKGAIACKEPKRNRWGGPPASEAGSTAQPGTIAADKSAFVPRGKVVLASMIVGGEEVANHEGLGGGGATPVDAGATPAAPAKGGCAGCAISSNDPVNGAWASLVAIAALALRSRSRRNRR
jgi:hypothetical protein